MKSQVLKGWIAPGPSETSDVRDLAAFIKPEIYERQGVCQQDDCSDDETPARVTITISVEHRERP